MCSICRSAPCGIAPSSFFLDKCTMGPPWMCGPWASRPETVTSSFFPIDFFLFANRTGATRQNHKFSWIQAVISANKLWIFANERGNDGV